MDELFAIQEISNITHKFSKWLEKYILTVDAVQQFFLVALILFAVWVVSKKINFWITEHKGNWERNFSFISSKVHISLQEVITLLLTPLLLLSVALVSKAIDAPFSILKGAASLAIAWTAIRMFSSLIKSRFLSGSLALSIWIIAALNILGWLEPTITILDKSAINMGEYKLSLLMIIKGGILVTALLWLAGLIAEGIERTLWQTQSLTPSQKVLFTKITKIFLVTLAVIWGLSAVGIDLTGLAIFSGALGIGIGFGLQKVFANLVSGFILLIDKSIKPGDVIAINDTYGWVNRLGARHISILTRDGKEHLIPNETLITERVENWSYSSDKVRIHIPIKVSYKSDIKLVKKLLLEIIRNNNRILKSPEPTCLIAALGESSVDFEIRAWIEDPINGIGSVRSQVYEEAIEVFRANGISIPYPHRKIIISPEHIKEILQNN